MGADIVGWVETRRSGAACWDSAVRISDIVFRSYAMFASLFGVRNGEPGKVAAVGRFRAVAPGRGAPPEASQRYVEERESYGGAVGETWALWRELAAIDWDEEGADDIGAEPLRLMYGGAGPGPGPRRERRGDYLTAGWATLFKLMAVLAEQFGADNVRLSVWFDQW